MYFQNLKKKILKKKATVAVIGLGYVGLPLLVQFHRKGFKCIGIDNDKSKISSFSKHKSENNYFGSILKKKISTLLIQFIKLNFLISTH